MQDTRRYRTPYREGTASPTIPDSCRKLSSPPHSMVGYVVGEFATDTDPHDVAAYEMESNDVFEEDSLGYYHVKCCQTQPEDTFPSPVRSCAVPEDHLSVLHGCVETS